MGGNGKEMTTEKRADPIEVIKLQAGIVSLT